MKSLGLIGAAMLLGNNALKLNQDYSSLVFKLDGPQAEDILSGMSADMQISFQDKDMKWQAVGMNENAPNLVVFRSQGCPECEGMVKDWESLAETCRLKGININIDSVDREDNLKLMKKQGIYQYPTIRFF